MKNKKVLIGICTTIILVIIVVIIMLISKKQDRVELYVNSEKIILSSSDENTNINLNTFNFENDTIVKALGKVDIKVNGKKLKTNKEYNFGKIEISEKNIIKVDVVFGQDNVTKNYRINTLPETFPEYDATNNGDIYDGDYYMCTYAAQDATSYIFKTNSDGKIIYYKKVPGFCSRFRKQLSSSGQIRYIYTAQDMDDTSTVDMNNIYGKMIIMDNEYNVIDEVKYINTSGNNYKTYTIFEYIDDGHYIATSSEKQLVNNVPGMPELTVTQNNIEEIKNKEVVFEWKSEEHPELYDYIENINGMSLTETNDYLHINSVIIDPDDNNFLISFRNNSTIMKIDRKTGKIMWSLGGIKDEFGLTDYQKFGYQHCLSFTKNHELMIFDNGDNRPAQGIKTESRVLKIKLDEANKKIEQFNEYKLDNVYSMAMGSVQVIDEENDIFLVTYGTGIFSKGPVELIDFKNNISLFTFNLHSNKMMFSSQKS